MNEQDYGIPIEGMTPEAIDSQMSAIRLDADFKAGAGSKTGGNQRAIFLQDRLTKLYEKKYPESPDRLAELPENRTLHDTLVKEFGSTERVEDEADSARLKMDEEINEGIVVKAEGELKEAWGPAYEQNLSVMKYTLDNFFDSENRAAIISALGNDASFISALVDVAGRLGDKFGWLAEAKKYKREDKE